MAMISMKLTKKEKTEDKALISSAEQPNKYPYGLTLDIDGDELDKLGMRDLPEIGTKMSLMAIVEVTSTRESKRDGEESHRSANFQITNMELRPAMSKKKQEDILFGGK